MSDSSDLGRFVRGELDPQRFSHREHVRMAFEMLAREDFANALARYTAALKALLTRVGRPEAFNQTTTVAYLALIAERMDGEPPGGFEQFAALHGELLEPGFLERWYEPERLRSAQAQRLFVMPAPRRPRR